MTAPQLLANFSVGALSASAGIADTSLSSAGFAALPSVAAPYELRVTLDPDAEYGDPEIVAVTAHSTSASTVTVTRAQDGTAARVHPDATRWRAAIVASHLDVPRGRLAIVTTQSTVTGITNTATWTDWAGMSFSVDVGSRPIALRCRVPGALNNTAAAVVRVRIYDVTGAAAVEMDGWQSDSANHLGDITIDADVSPAAGARTYKLQYQVSAGSGSLVYGGAANYKAQFAAYEV